MAMENYNMIIAGIIGSAVTLLLTALLDYLKERHHSMIEIRKLVFQRRVDAAENAVSWLQEGIDCLRMMQSACDDIEEVYNPVVCERLFKSAAQANILFENAGNSLNRIYLYYNFADIENKYNTLQSWEYINFALTEIGKLDQQALALRNSGLSDDCEEIKSLQAKAIKLFRNLSKSLNSNIDSMVEILNKLRSEFDKYSK